MTKLTNLQRQMLISISKCADGAFEPEVAKRATSGLLKRGLLFSVPQAEGPNRLIITEAGKVVCGEKTNELTKLASATNIQSPGNTRSEPSFPPVALIRNAKLSASIPARPAILTPDGERSNEGPIGKPASPTGPSSPLLEPKGKVGALVALLRRSEGVTLAEMMAVTGWKAHSVRGTLSGAIKNSLGRKVISRQTETGRVYTLPVDSAV